MTKIVAPIGFQTKTPPSGMAKSTASPGKAGAVQRQAAPLRAVLAM